MTRTRKTIAIISGTILVAIVLFFIVLATFDWNRLKPTINQKVSAELNRPFAIRGDLGVVWERQPGERGWRRWIPGRTSMPKISFSATRRRSLRSPWCICRELKPPWRRWRCLPEPFICRGLSWNSPMPA
jgi:uncharacterized protein involved in outer membrane biogenesis